MDRKMDETLSINMNKSIWIFSIAIQNESVVSVVYFSKTDPTKLSERKQSQFMLSSIADFAKMTVSETKTLLLSSNDNALELMLNFITTR